MADTGDCDCTCHTGPYAACDVPGGCGSEHHTKPGTCLLCPVFRPDPTPRQPHRPPVCDSDRTLIDRHLADIANLIADLTNDEEPIIDNRQHERFATVYFEGGHRHTWSKGMYPSDPLAPLGGVAPINSRTKAPSVSGSRERPIPIRVAELDLKAPAKVPNLTPASMDWPEDQIGHLAAATVLDQWVRDIRDTLHPSDHLPPATVDQLVLWLRNRVEDVCDRHPAVAEFAEEIRSLRGALRSAAGETDPPPEPCDGINCARCNKRALYRRPGDTYRAECSTCGTLYTEAEYAVLIAEQARTERQRRDPEEITALLRHS